MRFIILCCAGCLYFFMGNPSFSQTEQKWFTAKNDTLRVTLVETGEINAVKSTTVSAPKIYSMEMQIIDMVPEGVYVDSGDVIVELDKSALLSGLEEKQTEYDMKAAELASMKVQHESKIRTLKQSMELAEFSSRLALLNLKKLEFESDSKKEDGELEKLKADISLKEAETKLKAQYIINAAERKKQELLILQAAGKVAEIKRQLKQFTLRAPISGLAVYHADWDGSKKQIGVKVRPGSGIIDLPDLKSMRAIINVNEVDGAKLSSGLTAAVRLDAYPDKLFSASVEEINTIADPLTYKSQVRIFKTKLLIHDEDEDLKPGMTARVSIVLNEYNNVTLIPIGCIFEIDGEPVVFTRETPSQPTPVKLQARNDYFAYITGIDAGREVGYVAGAPGAKPLGYMAWQRGLRPRAEDRDAFFAEMEKRHLIFDYEAHRTKPPEPPGGAPGGQKEMLKKLGIPAGELTAKGGQITLTSDQVMKLKATSGAGASSPPDTSVRKSGAFIEAKTSLKLDNNSTNAADTTTVFTKKK